MNDQSKIPGAMVLVSRETVLRVLDDAAYINQVDRQTLRDAVAEQTPASPMAERIRQAMIADSGQEGVNIAEGRFGKAMAALCVQLDGQTPAVGGEPEVLGWLYKGTSMGDQYMTQQLNHYWPKPYGEEHDYIQGVALIDRAHVAHMESAAKTLESMGYTNNGGELWKPPIGKKPDLDMMDRLHTRLAELEAQIVDLKINVALAVDYSGSLEDQIAKANDWQHLKPDMSPQKP